MIRHPFITTLVLAVAGAALAVLADEIRCARRPIRITEDLL